MTKVKFTVLAAIIFGAFLSFAPKAHAQTFNGRSTLHNWAGTTNPVFRGGSPALGAGASNTTLISDFCTNQLFKFQTNNLFIGTFCDLGSIVALSSAHFATNVTCTIQSVSMNNYDNNVTFSTDSASGTICRADNASRLTGATDPEIFGTGNSSGTSGTGGTGGSGSQTGVYAPGFISQLTADLTGNSWIRTGYGIVRNFGTILAFIFLLIFAFANILNIDINTYTIKKMIPNIVLAVVGAYLAIFGIALLSRGIDFLYRLEFFSPYNALHPYYNMMNGNFGALIINDNQQNINALNIVFRLGAILLGEDPTTGTIQPSLISGMIGVIFMSIPAVVSFAFSYLLALRPIVVGILTILSPVAFAAYIFPSGQNLFRKWVTILGIALFYTPAVHLILYFANLIPVSNASQPLLIVFLILIKTTIFAFLIRMPFTIESDIQKISLALSKTSLGAGLGMGKLPDKNLKAKQENQNPITDKILESKAAKSLIAPVNNSYRRDIISSRVSSGETRRSLSQVFNRNRGPLIKNIDEVSDKAHQSNLLRSTGLLINSIADLSPQSLRKIAASSNFKLAHDNALISELKQKNGQILDDEGAMTRADAGRKVIRSAELVEQGKLGNPEAVKLLSQKQMLDVLPIEILKQALVEGVINKDDIRNNFKGNPDQVAEKIARFNRGKVLNSAELATQTQKDFTDSKTGYTDLISAIKMSLADRPEEAKTNIVRAVEMAKNQSNFDKNGFYYLARLNETKNDTKQTLATSLKQTGVPPQTAIALSQNPALNYQQISAYIPKTAPAQTLQVIRETIAERNSADTMIGQISSSLKEDKVVLGRAIAEKVSESLNKGTVKSFDDVKRQITDSLKGLNANSSPQEVKAVSAKLNSFTPVAQVQTAAGSTPEEVEKIKDKGEAVLSTIDEMKMAQVDEKTLKENPQKAVEQYSNQVQNTINQAANGQTKAEKKGPSEQQMAESQLTADKMQNQQSSETDAATETSQNPSQIADTMSKVLSSDAKEGTTFEQKLTDISKNQPKKEAEPQAGAANG